MKNDLTSKEVSVLFQASVKSEGLLKFKFHLKFPIEALDLTEITKPLLLRQHLQLHFLQSTVQSDPIPCNIIPPHLPHFQLPIPSLSFHCLLAPQQLLKIYKSISGSSKPPLPKLTKLGMLP